MRVYWRRSLDSELVALLPPMPDAAKAEAVQILTEIGAFTVLIVANEWDSAAQFARQSRGASWAVPLWKSCDRLSHAAVQVPFSRTAWDIFIGLYGSALSAVRPAFWLKSSTCIRRFLIFPAAWITDVSYIISSWWHGLLISVMIAQCRWQTWYSDFSFVSRLKYLVKLFCLKYYWIPCLPNNGVIWMTIYKPNNGGIAWHFTPRHWEKEYPIHVLVMLLWHIW